MFILVVFIFILLALSDFPRLIKDKKWKMVGILGGFYVVVLTLAILLSFGVTLPSPYVGAQKLIVDVLHLGYPKP